MYCKRCGEKSHPNNNYCAKDGTYLKSPKKFRSLRISGIKFCGKCGEQLSKEDLYCQSCGESTFSLEKEKNLDLLDMGLADLELDRAKIKEKFTLTDSSNFIYGILGFLISVILSFVFASRLNLAYPALLSYGTGQLSNFIREGIATQIISPLKAIPLLSASKILISLPEGSLEITVGYVLPIMLTLLNFSLLGYIKSRNNKDLSTVSLIINSFIYSILIVLASSYSVHEINLAGKVTILYNVVSVFINSFLLSFIGLLIGYGLERRKKDSKNSNSIKAGILQGAVSFFILFVVITIVSGFFISEYDAFGGKEAISLQSGAYTFFASNFVLFNLSGINTYIFSSDLHEGAYRLMTEVFYIYSDYVIVSMLVTIVYLFMKGVRAKGKSIKYILAMSLSYSAILAFISVISSINKGPDFYGVLYINEITFSFLSSFLPSLALVSASGAIGFSLRKLEENLSKNKS